MGPDLGEDADVGSIDHIRLEELKERGICVVALEFAHVFDILQFFCHERAVRVTFTVHEGENGVAVLPAVFACEPARRLGEEAHSDEEKDCWDHLQSPWEAECGRAIDEGAAIGDVEHD